MVVAWIINHRGHGFFIFRPGEGWEYVMTLTLVALALLFGLVRPAVLAAMAKPEETKGGNLDAVIADETELVDDFEMPQLLASPQMAKKLEGARQLARDNPTAVANIVRGWVNNESSI